MEFNFPRAVKHKEKRKRLIEQRLVGLPVIVRTAEELSDVDSEIMGDVVKEGSFNKRLPCRHTYQQGNSLERPTTVLDLKANRV